MANRYFILLMAILLSGSVFAQNNPSIWTELEFSRKINKRLKIEFNPELRLRDAFSMDSTKGWKMDSYILEAGLSYKLNRFFTLAAFYRFEEEYDAKYKRKLDENGEKIVPKEYEYIYSSESLNRLAFDLKSGFDYLRFDFQLRVRYTQGLYANNANSEWRYRGKASYDIPGSKLSPFINVEFFHDQSISGSEREIISGNMKTIDKIRYTGGFSYEINKNNELNLFYRLQDNRIKNENTNILGFGFSHNF